MFKYSSGSSPARGGQASSGAMAFCAGGALAFGEEATNKMYYIYVLKSEKDGIRYVGSGEDYQERLRRHNKGDYRFTKGHRPWRVVYNEKYSSRSEAVKRERFLKSGQGRKLLDNIVGKAAGSSNGRTPPFEGGYEGPNPSPAALPRNN